MADATSSQDLKQARIMLGLLDSVGRGGAKSQRHLAGELGIALGLVNAYLKRCVKRGAGQGQSGACATLCLLSYAAGVRGKVAPYGRISFLFESVTDSERVLILLDLLGRKVRVALHAEDVVAA